MPKHQVPLNTLKDCFRFLLGLKNGKRVEEVARQLHGRIKKYYKNSQQLERKLKSRLSRLLTTVDRFYVKLVYETVVRRTYKVSQHDAGHLLDALLECMPKFLAAMYFLLYNVDESFAAVKGGKWKENHPGVDGNTFWWRALRSGEWGGELQKYLTSSNSNHYYGIVPGGFKQGDVKHSFTDGYYLYYRGENMVEDIKYILSQNSGHNYFRDVFVTSVISDVGTQAENTANAIGLVGVFCEIVRDDDGTVQKVLEEGAGKLGKCLNWEKLKSHCKMLKTTQIDTLFKKETFDHTGQSPKISTLHKAEFAKKTARWLLDNLEKVRENFTLMKRVDYTSSIIGYNLFASKYLFPYGFIFGEHSYGTFSNASKALRSVSKSIIDPLSAKDSTGHLKKLKRLLEGRECTAEDEAPDSEDDTEPEDEDEVYLDVELVGDELVIVPKKVEHPPAKVPELPTKPLSEKKPSPPTRTQVTKTEAAKPTVTTTRATPTPGGKPDGAANQSNTAKGPQNPGSKNDVSPNQNSGQNRGKSTTASAGTSSSPPSVGTGTSGTAGPKSDQGQKASSGPKQTSQVQAGKTTVISQKTPSPSPPQQAQPPPAPPPKTPAGPGSPSQPGVGGGSPHGGGALGPKPNASTSSAKSQPSSVQLPGAPSPGASAPGQGSPSGAGRSSGKGQRSPGGGAAAQHPVVPSSTKQSQGPPSSSASNNSGGQVSSSDSGPTGGKGQDPKGGDTTSQKPDGASQSVTTPSPGVQASGPSSSVVPAPGAGNGGVPGSSNGTGSTSGTIKLGGQGIPQTSTTANGTTSTDPSSGSSVGGAGGKGKTAVEECLPPTIDNLWNHKRNGKTKKLCDSTYVPPNPLYNNKHDETINTLWTEFKEREIVAPLREKLENERRQQEDEDHRMEENRQLQIQATLPDIDVVFKPRESSDKSLNAYWDAIQNQLKSVPPTVGLQVTVPSRYDANSDDNTDVFDFGKSVTLNIVKPDLIDVDESVEPDLDKTLVYNSDVKGDVVDHVNDIMIVDVSGEDVPEDPDPVLEKPSNAKAQRIVAQHNVDSLISGQATSDAKGIPNFAVPQGSAAIGVPIGYSIKPPKLPKIPPLPPPTMELNGNPIPDYDSKYFWLPPPGIHIESAPRTLPAIDVDIEKPYTAEEIMKNGLRRTTYLPQEMIDPEPLPAYNVDLDVAPKLKVYNNSSYMPTAELKPQPLSNPDFSIHLPKPALQDTSYDLNIDEPPPLPNLQPLDPIKPSTTAVSVNFPPIDPPESLPNRYVDPYTHDAQAVGMCIAPWMNQAETGDSTDILETELFPAEAPSTVRDMLQWLAGLKNERHHNTLENCINKAFSGLNDEPSQLALSINGSHIIPQHLLDTIHLTAMFAGSVLNSIAPNWKANVSSKTMTTKSTTQSDEPDCCALLCQLRDYAYACHHQLQFLKSQCSRNESRGGWKNCEYGSEAKMPSPLQAFLTDAYDSKFKTHLFDPCNICLKSRIHMGFTHNDLPKPHQTGDTLFAILSPSCGGEDPLMTLCSYLNCLTRRTPRTTAELVSYFHHFGNSLHDMYLDTLLPLGSALSESHPDCPDWGHLGRHDLQAVRGIRGSELLNTIYKSNSKHDHPNTLSTLVGCGSDSSNCLPRMSPITYRAYALYSQSFAHTYLSWTVYLPDLLWKSLEKLHYDFQNHKCFSDKFLHSCSTALPLLYSHGFTPPEGTSQVSLKCSDVICKLQEIVDGGPIASLMTAMDNFLYGIREPFIYTLVTLWFSAFLLFANTMLYRLDVLRIRSHFIRSRVSHVIDVKALLTDGAKMPSLYDIDYFDEDALSQFVVQ